MFTATKHLETEGVQTKETLRSFITGLGLNITLLFLKHESGIFEKVRDFSLY